MACHATDPTSADHWVRHLEEEAGAICESRVDVGASAECDRRRRGSRSGSQHVEQQAERTLELEGGRL